MFKLIIVEDEVKIRNGLVRLFPWESLQFEVVGEFGDGEAALRFMQDHSVDCVLTDIRMPRMDGFALAHSIREQYGDSVLVVFLTSYHDYGMMREAICANAQDYLLKPAGNKELTACFERVGKKLAEKHGEVETPAPPRGYYTQIVDSVKKYVQENIRDCSLERAADLVGLSPSYLSRVFKEKTGGLFMGYVTEVRMKKAAELLGSIAYKQYEVAFMVGYDNQQNFSRAFKQYYGVSPSRYRNQTLDEGSGT